MKEKLMIVVQIVCNLAVYAAIYSIGYNRGIRETKKADYILEKEIRKIALSH